MTANRWRAVLAILLMGGLAACVRAPSETGAFDEKTRATMADIVAELRVLLPLASSEERFAAPANAETVTASLRALADTAGRLERHGETGDAAFGFMSRSLAHDAGDAFGRWEAGRPAEARFLVQELVEDCVGCHSRLKGPSSAELGPSLLVDVDSETLDEREWARLLVATRQFGAALDVYESVLGSPEGPITRLDLESVVVDYLVVCVRVSGDLARARATLELVAARSDLPRYLAVQVAGWSDSLVQLEAREPLGSALEQTRALLAPASAAEPVVAPMFDRRRLIHDLVASGLLHEYVRTHPDAPPEKRAEAYYWLGVTELRVHRSLWLSPADAYLEASIRSAPASQWAADAYLLLEAHTLFEYEGSSGLHLPDETLRRLDELRETLE
jgi:hypothetical protein